VCQDRDKRCNAAAATAPDSACPETVSTTSETLASTTTDAATVESDAADSSTFVFIAVGECARFLVRISARFYRGTVCLYGGVVACSRVVV